MKKLSLLVASISMAVFAFGAPATLVSCSSEGPDCYADGTEVLKGEVYALVWIADGAKFAGIKADGTEVDSVNNKILAFHATDVKGRCGDILFIFTGANADLISTGTLSVYLLDTRTFKAEEGEVVVAEVKGLNADDKVDVVNTVTSVADAVAKGGVTTVAKSGAVTSDAAVATAEKPQPVVSSIKVSNSHVTVKVTNTLPYFMYGISAGETPAELDPNAINFKTRGTLDGNLTIEVDDPKYRFFKVISK